MSDSPAGTLDADGLAWTRGEALASVCALVPVPAAPDAYSLPAELAKARPIAGRLQPRAAESLRADLNRHVLK
jgi:hypothetical protein